MDAKSANGNRESQRHEDDSVSGQRYRADLFIRSDSTTALDI